MGTPTTDLARRAHRAKDKLWWGGVVALLVAGSAGVAVAAIPDTSGRFDGCVNNATGVLRVVDRARSGTWPTASLPAPRCCERRRSAGTLRDRPDPQEPSATPVRQALRAYRELLVRQVLLERPDLRGHKARPVSPAGASQIWTILSACRAALTWPGPSLSHMGSTTVRVRVPSSSRAPSRRPSLRRCTRA